MCAVVIEGENLHIPAWVQDLASFRRWAESDAFPEQGRICYLAGEVWIDMSKEQLFSHNKIKTRFYIVLGALVDQGELGSFFSDGVSLVHPEADLSAIPDALFFSNETLERGRIRLVEGQRQGYVEVEGSPDMVLEVVSDASVKKDTIRLKKLYWQAGVREYWLVDARGASPSFEILRRSPRGFAAVRPQAGWVKSTVFDKAFRLTQEVDALGYPTYTVSVR
jgi:Uma2 family endonuclease